jgi:hypothetical protein
MANAQTAEWVTIISGMLAGAKAGKTKRERRTAKQEADALKAAGKAQSDALVDEQRRVNIDKSKGEARRAKRKEDRDIIRTILQDISQFGGGLGAQGPGAPVGAQMGQLAGNVMGMAGAGFNPGAGVGAGMAGQIGAQEMKTPEQHEEDRKQDEFRRKIAHQERMDNIAFKQKELEYNKDYYKFSTEIKPTEAQQQTAKMKSDEQAAGTSTALGKAGAYGEEQGTQIEPSAVSALTRLQDAIIASGKQKAAGYAIGRILARTSTDIQQDALIARSAVSELQFLTDEDGTPYMDASTASIINQAIDSLSGQQTTATYTSPEEVRSALESGAIGSVEEAAQILRTQFGYE